MSLSLHVPGSDSSALIVNSVVEPTSFGANDHFKPVEKPAPPLPLNSEVFTSFIIHSRPLLIKSLVSFQSSRFNEFSISQPNSL